MHDFEIEKELLYYIIFENFDCNITVDDFVSTQNQEIAEVIINLKTQKEPLEMSVIAHKCKKPTEVLEYLSSIVDNLHVKNPINIYNEIVKMSENRATYRLMQMFQEQFKNGTANKNDFMLELEKIKDRTISGRTLKQQLVEAMKTLEETFEKRNDRSLYTGLHTLDQKILGLHDGELTIIGARPRCWKNNLSSANCR